MMKKIYIFVLMFLCLLIGQVGYAWDIYLDEVVIDRCDSGNINYDFCRCNPDFCDCTNPLSPDYPCEYEDTGDCTDERSAAYPCNYVDPCDPDSYDECLCEPASCDDDTPTEPTEPQDPPSAPDPEKVLLVELINKLCSDTMKAQVAKAFDNNRLSKIEVRIVDEFIDNGLLGLHQVYDNNGKLLEWDNTINDFNGTPSYLPDGSYSNGVITIYRENISRTCTSVGCGNAQYYGINMTLEESVASTFSHELNHNTDLEFIIDLRNRREGKPSQNIDPHQNITPQEKQVWNELNNCN